VVIIIILQMFLIYQTYMRTMSECDQAVARWEVQPCVHCSSWYTWMSYGQL